MKIIGEETVNGTVVAITNQRVDDSYASAALITRFGWRARRKARRMNDDRFLPFYRWAVIREDGLYLVVAFQNVAIRLDNEQRHGPDDSGVTFPDDWAEPESAARAT